MPSQASYDQRTGAFVIYGDVDENAGTERVLYEAQGYAGRGACKNNPDCEHKRNEGPLPLGRYRVVHIIHDRYRDPVFRLLQLEGPTYGRSGFLIHGDSAKAPGKASRGCIVLGWAARSAIHQFDVRTLEVCATDPDDAGMVIRMASDDDVEIVPASPLGRVLDTTVGSTGTND